MFLSTLSVIPHLVFSPLCAVDLQVRLQGHLAVVRVELEVGDRLVLADQLVFYRADAIVVPSDYLRQDTVYRRILVDSLRRVGDARSSTIAQNGDSYGSRRILSRRGLVVDQN